MSEPSTTSDLKRFLKSLGSVRSEEACVVLRQRLHRIARANLDADDQLRRILSSEDVTQDAFVHIIEALPRFRGSTWTEFLGFAASILRGRLVDNRRHYGAQKRDAGNLDSLPLADQQAHPRPTPSYDAMTEEEVGRIRALLSGLKPELRDPLEARLGGRSYSEIAESHGLTESTVRKRVSRAIQALRDLW